MERRKVEGIRHASDSDRYVGLEKGSFPLDGLPDGFGDKLEICKYGLDHGVFLLSQGVWILGIKNYSQDPQAGLDRTIRTPVLYDTISFATLVLSGQQRTS
jgi:hypothetical protein